MIPPLLLPLFDLPLCRFTGDNSSAKTVSMASQFALTAQTGNLEAEPGKSGFIADPKAGNKPE